MSEKYKCALTLKDCDKLSDSHIFPKFMFNHLKKTGGTVFRAVDSPTRVLQDGFSCRLLGGEAEQMFSKREKWFANHVFRPYINDNTLEFDYDENLFYFSISLLWRLLYLNRSNFNGDIVNCLIGRALEDWRLFLSGEREKPNEFFNIYIAPTRPESFTFCDISIDGNKLSYIKREFDFNILETNTSNDYAVYCKFPYFILWGVLKRDDNLHINYGYRINPLRGKMDFHEFKLNPIIEDFIFQRMLHADECFEKSGKQLSTKASDAISKRLRENKSFIGSELYEIVSKRIRCFF
jgi:hypothetical protein